jgi:hypothetical protein
MLGAPGEENYNENEPKNLVNSYFEKEWIENDGVYYITKKVYKSKTFISFTHPISGIVRAISGNGMCIYNMQDLIMIYQVCLNILIIKGYHYRISWKQKADLAKVENAP